MSARITIFMIIVKQIKDKHHSYLVKMHMLDSTVYHFMIIAKIELRQTTFLLTKIHSLIARNTIFL